MREQSKTCGKKVRYASKESAENSASNLLEHYNKRKLRLRTRKYIRAYQCPFCTFWHVGHTQYEKDF